HQAGPIPGYDLQPVRPLRPKMNSVPENGSSRSCSQKLTRSFYRAENETSRADDAERRTHRPRAACVPSTISSNGGIVESRPTKSWSTRRPVGAAAEDQRTSGCSTCGFAIGVDSLNQAIRLLFYA